MTWKIGCHALTPGDRSVIMGILNVTPDSFSDGGKFDSLQAAKNHAGEMIRQGARIIDIGGESTRPGAELISPEKELARVLPVIKELRSFYPETLLSLDTRNASTAEAGLSAGINIINDISGLSSPDMLSLCKSTDCGLIIMHMKGEPKTMQQAPHYDDVIREVSDFFAERRTRLTQAGISPERICFDPGIGFGKSTAHNTTLIKHIDSLNTQGCALMMALSRKRILSDLLGDTNDGRLPLSTAVATLLCHQKGVRLHRVHDVKECAIALRLHDCLY